MASLLVASAISGCAIQPYVDLPDGTRKKCVLAKCYEDALAQKAAMEQRQKEEQEAMAIQARKAKDEADAAALAEKVAKEEKEMKQAEQDKIMREQPKQWSLEEMKETWRAAERLGSGSQPAQDQSPDWQHLNAYGCPSGMVPNRMGGGCKVPEHQYYPGGYPARSYW